MGLFGDIGGLLGGAEGQEDYDRKAEEARKQYAETGRQAAGTLGGAKYQTGESQVKLDPGLEASRRGGIDRLTEIANAGGMDPQSIAAQQEAMNRADTQARGQREALKTSAQARGMGGGGTGLALEQGANQNAANQARMTGLQAAGDARTRSLQAIGESGRLAGEAQGQNIQAGSAANQLAQFNAGQRARQAEGMAGAQLGQGNLAAGTLIPQGEAQQKTDTAFGAGLGGIADKVAGGATGGLFAEGGVVGGGAGGFDLSSIMGLLGKGEGGTGAPDDPGMKRQGTQGVDQQSRFLTSNMSGEGSSSYRLGGPLALAEGGVVGDPMANLLAGPETTDEDSRQKMAESKKYKKAKPGDPGVQTFDLEGDEPKPGRKGAQKYAEGGAIPGTNDYADDRVPILASPGEVVIDRETIATPEPSRYQRILNMLRKSPVAQDEQPKPEPENNTAEGLKALMTMKQRAEMMDKLARGE
jgi:hypothetical protein